MTVKIIKVKVLKTHWGNIFIGKKNEEIEMKETTAKALIEKRVVTLIGKPKKVVAKKSTTVKNESKKIKDKK